jgi:hypothetical protein
MSEKKFWDGGHLPSEEFLHSTPYIHTIRITEEERQMVLLALAELSIARPGWISSLEEIALKMDNKTEDGRAEMFDQFRRNHSNPLAEKLSKE